MSNIIGPTLRMGSRQVLGGSSPHIAGVVVAGSKGWAHMLTTARHLGVLKDFMNKVDEEMEKDPETKKKWSELKDQTQSMAKQASEWAKTAKQATEEASGKLREGATKVREQVAETVKAGGSTLSELKERAGAAASAAGPTKQSDTTTTTTTATSSDGESAAAEQRAETANAAPSGEGGAGSAMGRDAQATPSGQAAVEFLKGVHEGLFQGGSKQQEAGSTPGEREQGGTASQQQQQQQQQGGGWGTEGSQAAGWRSRSPFAGFAAQAERPGSSGDADAEKRSAMARAQQLLATIRKEVADAVLPQQEFLSMTRSRDEVSAPPPEAEQQTAASDLQVVKAKETWWGKYFNTMKDRMGSHPFFQRISSLRESSMMKRGRELAGDIRDQWETSDHPLVHRIQDMQDSLFMETEAAKALREIRLRDPDFDMIRFLHSIKLDVPLLIGAYLRGQKEVLEKHCSDAMLERLMGITNALHSQNHFSDPTILEHSDVELVDLKVLDDEPVIVVQFTCQQINCVRDQFGNVIEGSEDDIQRVYYYWALQQEAQGTVTKSGNVLPPRWQLTEMLVRGMHHLL